MPSKMKAVVMEGFGSAEVLHLGVVERPAPDDTQVLIQVAATSVNRPDIVQREGNYPPPPGESDVLGLEIAGTVVELGKYVTTGISGSELWRWSGVEDTLSLRLLMQRISFEFQSQCRFKRRLVFARPTSPRTSICSVSRAFEMARAFFCMAAGVGSILQPSIFAMLLLQRL